MKQCNGASAVTDTCTIVINICVIGINIKTTELLQGPFLSAVMSHWIWYVFIANKTDI